MGKLEHSKCACLGSISTVLLIIAMKNNIFEILMANIRLMNGFVVVHVGVQALIPASHLNIALFQIF